MRFALLACLATMWAAQAAAEELAAGISRDTIEITSNFTGTDVVTFGAIEPEPGETVTPTASRDVVVVMRSVEADQVVVRKKERLGPIWVNREQRRFSGVPAYYFVASTRPLKDIARADVLEQLELGLDHLAIGPAPGSIGGPRDFRNAIIREKKRAGLYSEHPGGVSFLSQTLFRTTAKLPANVPAGDLKVFVYLFSKGDVVSSNLRLYVDKQGIERRLSTFASQLPWLYGIAAVALSVLAGFLSSLAFRARD